MLHKTNGIALKTTNYSESSIVAHVYTESFGMQAYLINGAKKHKAKISSNLFQPLHPLDLVVYHKETSGLNRIKEVRQVPVLRDIPMNIQKSSVAIFINEILYKVLREQSGDPYLFHFVLQSILWLDESESPLANFHIVFLVKLSRFLGFLPLQPAHHHYPYFDLMGGVFSNSLPAHSYVLQEPHTSLFYTFLSTSYEKASAVKISKIDRKYLLEKILEFYKLHTENFGIVNSMYVLEEIFH